MQPLKLSLAFSILTVSASIANASNSLPDQSTWLGDNFSVSANVALVSNYIWRGVSQTDNGPAMQGQFKLKSVLGFYGSVWGSNVNFLDAQNKTATGELDYIVGFEKQIHDFGIDFGAYFYTYPKTTGIDYTESFVRLSYKIVHFGVGYTHNFFDTGGSGTYYFGGLDYTIKSHNVYLQAISIGGGAGYYALNGPVFAGKSYWNYRLYLKKSFKHFAAELAWTDTDGGLGLAPWDDSHIVAILSASIG